MTKMTPSALNGAPVTQLDVKTAASKAADRRLNKPQGLYDPRNEHDACGVGFIAHMKGEKSHQIVKDGLFILENLTHRGAVGADPLMGDGAGMLMQIPDRFFREEMAKRRRHPAEGRRICRRLFLHAARRGPDCPLQGRSSRR